MALSLGHTQINSKQGEPLRASIEIYSASAEELQGLGVQLFGQTDYQALGLSWDKSLASTRLDLIESKDGRLFVNIQGREALEQSFVELFFEMHWNSGQVNKQVGLLLDPVERKVGVALPQERSNKIVLVNRGDSASQLIKPYLPDDVSMDQMLLALVQSNPKSFVNGNVNRLLSGSTLQIPQRELALLKSTDEAQSQVRAQAQDFNTYRQALLGKIKSSKTKKTRKG
jgi:pilus assembly protein FimV